MADKRPDYLAYLLRLWRASDDGESHHGGEKPVWRASVQCAYTRECRGFASLDDLFDFIRRQTDTTADETHR
jgi:hypothetical protein